MKRKFNTLRPALLCLIIFTVICGVFYTGAVTGIAQLIFPKQANGSIVTVTLKDGIKMEIGSELIGQEFTAAQYLIGRPMGVSNLASTSKNLEETVKSRIQWWHEFDQDNTAAIPNDLIYASGSGADPYISVEAAQYQAARIARIRGISEDDVRAIIDEYTTNRFLGIFGEHAVNVLKVNLALDGLL